MSDKLVLKNMVFYGFHGFFAAEKELGQKIEVDLEVHTSLGHGDDPELAFNYVDAYALVKEIAEEREFSLLESLAHTIAVEILAMYDLEQVIVRVRKPNVPVGGPLDYLEAEVSRKPKGLIRHSD